MTFQQVLQPVESNADREVYEHLEGKAFALILPMLGLNPSRHTNDGMWGKRWGTDAMSRELPACGTALIDQRAYICLTEA